MLASICVSFVAVLHLLFAALEMILWTKPVGRKVFGTTEQFAKESSALAANQGLYNVFLAAGLIWGMITAEFSVQIQTFFLCCIICAGIFGAVTASRKILFVQAVPAGIALLVVWKAI